MIRPHGRRPDDDDGRGAHTSRNLLKSCCCSPIRPSVRPKTDLSAEAFGFKPEEDKSRPAAASSLSEDLWPDLLYGRTYGRTYPGPRRSFEPPFNSCLPVCLPSFLVPSVPCRPSFLRQAGGVLSFSRVSSLQVFAASRTLNQSCHYFSLDQDVSLLYVDKALYLTSRSEAHCRR